MPIEVRELVIRATVDPNATGKGSGSCGNGAGKSGAAESGGSAATAASGADDDMVQACVREVMRILEEKRER